MPLATLIDAILPAACCLCGTVGAGRLCTACIALLPDNPLCCARCGLPTAMPVAECGECLAETPAFEATHAGWRYQPPLDSLLPRLKFRQGLAVAEALGRVLALQLQSRGWPPPEWLLPLPLHPGRLRERGYNQAQELARVLARELGWPMRHDLLRRVRATAPQAGLDAKARRRNVRDAFAASGAVSGRRVYLCDDVMTTGATLRTAARALLDAGASEVRVIVAARRP